MDTSAARLFPPPPLEHAAKRLPSSRPDPDDSTRSKPSVIHSHRHHHNHNHSHSRGHSRSNSNPDTAHATSSAQDNTSGGSGLSLREQQQLRNQAAFAVNAPNSRSCSSSPPNRSPASLTLSITPPREIPPYLAVDPSSWQEHASGQRLQQQHSQQTLQNGSNNSFLGSSHDSLGSSLSRSQSGSRSASRRASFSLSTGSLTFNPSSSTSLASPSSPSYSTIAVARARAAAAAAAGQEANTHTAEGGAWGGLGGISEESGVFPGVPASIPLSSSAFSHSSSVVAPGSNPGSTSSIANYDSSLSGSRPNSGSGPHMSSSSLASSSSSLVSNESGAFSNHCGSGSGAGSSSTLPTHLQDNTKAEREVSMILDDFLYLGGELVEEGQISELERLGIKRVLNMAENCDDELWIQRFGQDGYLKVGLLDHVDQDLKDGLDEAIKFIASSKAPVYVHCQAGKSRSVATVIGYLIQERRWPLKKAYDHVVERRRIMSPNIGFVSQLVMLEERVLGTDKAEGLVSVSEDANPASRTTVMPWMTS